MKSPSHLLISPKHSLDPFLALRINDIASPKVQTNDISVSGTAEIEKALAMFNDNEKFSSVADQMRLKLGEIEKQKHEMLIELIGWKTKYVELEPKLEQLQSEVSTLRAEKASWARIKEELIDKVAKLSSLLVEAQNDRTNLKTKIKEMEGGFNPFESFNLPDWPSRSRTGFKKDLFDELLVAKKKIAEKEKEIEELKTKIKPEGHGPKLKPKPGSMMLEFEKRQQELKLSRNQSSKSHISVLDGDKENICEITSDSCRLKSPKSAIEFIKYQTDITNLKHSIEILLTENQRLVDALQKFEKSEKEVRTVPTVPTIPTSQDLKPKPKMMVVPHKKSGSVQTTAKVVKLDLNIPNDFSSTKSTVSTPHGPLSRKNSAPKPEIMLYDNMKNLERRSSVTAKRNY